MKKRYAFYFDSDRCIKCYACEVACKQWHGIKPDSVKLRKVIEITSGTFPEVKRKFVSVSCRHCGKAPCIEACLSKAISRREEDGIIVVDHEKCIGCKSCLEACPFGIPQFDENGIVQICDMCLDRLEMGQPPLCSATCPTKALIWGTLTEISNSLTVKGAQARV
jgi:anaerobic dimethyl sulfoxide reductase subunit B